MPKRTSKHCIFVDTNIFTDALYGKYVPGKSDPFKQRVASDFDKLLRTVLAKGGEEAICVSSFQLEVELIRATLNEAIRRAPRIDPNDVVALINACKTFIEQLDYLKEYEYVVVLDYTQPEVIKAILELYVKCRNLGIVKRRGGIGTQDLIIIASIYTLLKSRQCTSLELWTEDTALCDALQELSHYCQKSPSKYAITVVHYDKSARQTRQQPLYICTDP
ncbi:MAG: hypothetical protein GXO32_04290 [Crenarchaeota archaeon]|nr:hypothetical protein [Thermoproteota archaeon]